MNDPVFVKMFHILFTIHFLTLIFTQKYCVKIFFILITEVFFFFFSFCSSFNFASGVVGVFNATCGPTENNARILHLELRYDFFTLMGF